MFIVHFLIALPAQVSRKTIKLKKGKFCEKDADNFGIVVVFPYICLQIYKKDNLLKSKQIRKMGRKCLYMLFLLFVPCSLYSQTAQTKLWGNVKNTSGEVMDFAGIIVANPQSPNKILASAYTDEQGKYQVTVGCNSDSLLLRVSRIEMKPVVMKIPNRS